ncbi:ROK family protein [Amycolatopsis sp. cg5]|uniref:ROK family protein n=1 Tax=Amycolatopsis sp. cg5 TaxID=3238802 RepID=UPI003523AFBC
MVITALDVGGTSIKAAVLDGDLKTLATSREPTAKGADGHAVADQVARMVAELGHDPAAVGVVVPGIVDEDAGIARFSANLDWRDVPLRALLAERLGLPVALGHDVRSGGLAEFRVGAGRGCAEAAFVAVGTGIAAALLVDGKLHSNGGLAGELGHVDVGNQLKCGCGGVGCMEMIASASAVARRYTELTGEPADGAESVVLAAQNGDERAKVVVDEAVDGLARGLRILTTLLAPEVVVLGGGLFTTGEHLLDAVSGRLNLTFQRKPELRLAELGPDASRYGAGLLALDLLKP